MLMHVVSIILFGVSCFLDTVKSNDIGRKCKGCEYKGKCKPMEWTDPNQCINYECLRYQPKNKDSKNATFLTEILPKSYGCPFKGTCIRFGEKRRDKNTCMRYSCYKTYERSPILNSFYLGHIMKSDPIGCIQDGRCVPINHNLSDPNNCFFHTCIKFKHYDYRTKMYTTKTKFLRNSNGCPFRGTCMEFGTRIKDNTTCQMFTCYKTHKKTPDQISSIGHSIISGYHGCHDHDIGICRKEDEEWQDGCSIKKCIIKEVGSQVDVVDQGCYVDGICRLSGEEWKEGCITKKCVVDVPKLNKLKFPHELGRHLRCILKKECDISGLSRKAEIIERGCNDNGICRKEKEVWTDGCNRKKCISDGNERRIDYVSKGERDIYGKCHMRWKLRG